VANLAISAVCNQDCSYCFTVDHLEAGKRTVDHTLPADGRFLSVDAFEARLDFLARSDVREVRLLGGEPTLHPRFTELVDRARVAKMGVVVFTNGLMPENALACLEATSADQCTVMVNVNQPDAMGQSSSHELRRETIRRLGRRALLGFNIYRTDFQMDFLLPLIAETDCKAVVRLGMAHPCLSGSNQYIHPNQYRAIAIKIVRFARVAAKVGVKLDFDCGFVRCMFSKEDFDTLQATGANVGWRCNPILDVDLKGDVIHCYPLARLARLPLTPETDATSLRSAFAERTRPYRQAGVFKECSTCPFKAAGECPGGCLATTIRRFRHTPFHLKVAREAVA
jgi:sulfatase maturation enzyme AslB (radical SAM superfamily)